jgi:hypothetical protein
MEFAFQGYKKILLVSDKKLDLLQEVTEKIVLRETFRRKKEEVNKICL